MMNILEKIDSVLNEAKTTIKDFWEDYFKVPGRLC